MKSLRLCWNLWKRFARALGDLNARILFSLMYFFLTWPFALIVRLKHKPFAHHKNSTWHEAQSSKETGQSLEKQY